MTHPERHERRQAIVSACRDGMTAEAASEKFSVSLQTVERSCRIHGVIPIRESRRGRGGGKHGTIVDDWEAIDWSKRDTDIALYAGVSRERVRKMRRNLGKPNAVNHRRHRLFIQFREWANARRSDFAGLTDAEIARLYPRPIQGNQVRVWMNKLGIEHGEKPMSITRETLPDMVSKRQVNPNMDECWEWIKSATRSRIRVDGEERTLANAAYRAYHGKPPSQRWIVRRCGNDLCVNPSHLYAATPKESGEIRKANGRSSQSKLTPETAAEIRRRRAIGGRENRLSVLAKEFGICLASCWLLCSNRTHRVEESEASK
jgi:hypothetical protein